MRSHSGFTLIELLVVLAVLALLAGIVAPQYLERVAQAREVALKHNLAGLRTAIDQFYRDKGRYPDALAELVDRRYLRSVPEDPVTGRADTWLLLAPQGAAGKVFDVRSGASGAAHDGSAYATW